MARPMTSATYRRTLARANTKLLTTSVLLFQATGMLLLAFKGDALDIQALIFAAALPAVTILTVNLYAKLWQIDRAIMILVCFLCSVGLVTLQDIARASITPLQQSLFVLAGLFAMGCGIVLIRNLRRIERWQPYFMLAALALLLLPIVAGEWQYGAKNWVRLPGINLSFQPSEFGKPLLILFLSIGLSGQPSLRRSVPPILCAMALCALLLVSRDLGALLLFFLTTVSIYYVATSNAALAGAALAVGAGGAYAAYHAFPYVAKRVEVFLDPWSDPLDKGWQIIQALIAIGSGGLFGMGLGLGYPRNIPLYHSDFIFAAIAEEFGIIFALLLLAVYMLIIARGASVALNARSSFHALIATGVTLLIAYQTIVIVGGNVKMFPLTGVTLPFISAGGSSMVGMMGAVGMLLGVSSINAHDEDEDLKRMRALEAIQ